MLYDVIVVGLGPAGATASYALSRAGHKVLAFDKQHLPRYKPCAGGLSLKIEKVLPFADWYNLIETTVYDLILSYKEEDIQRFHSEQPIAFLIDRRKFDYYLVQKALDAGTEIHPAEPIRTVSEDSDKVVVTTPIRSYQARYLIGADGAKSIVARSLPVFQKNNPQYWIGLTTELDSQYLRMQDHHATEAIYIHFGTIPRGYGWSFPKKTQWSIGIAGDRDKLKPARAYFTQFIQSQVVVKDFKPDNTSVHLIPLYQEDNISRWSSRTILVGDAAAVVDPFLGEGIYYAIQSGHLAAQTLHAILSGQSESLAEYETRVRSEIGKELRIAQWIANAVYRVPALSYHLFKSNPTFFELYRSVLSGQTSYSDLVSAIKIKVESLFPGI
ncbi:MAG: NAD(P)/FAD-dependent oxidoreductase [bacterium]|nr:NAD(P)/FAD-dependent oxidoreductase [bacterium]